MAVFGLGIMPYITSSIIMQLLTVVIPKLQALQEQGEVGVKKINQYTRYVTVVLGAPAVNRHRLLVPQRPGHRRPDVFPPGTFTPANVGLVVLTLTAGTAMIMWLGELITQRGVGNGMSILIFTSVISTPASRVPGDRGRQGLGSVPAHDRDQPGRRGRCRVHGPGAAAYPGAVRQAGRGPQDDRRWQHLPAAEGEPGGRDPDHLRDVGDVLPVAARRASSRRQLVPEVRQSVLRRQPTRATST